jgi:hypothetical protein
VVTEIFMPSVYTFPGPPILRPAPDPDADEAERGRTASLAIVALGRPAWVSAPTPALAADRTTPDH